MFRLSLVLMTVLSIGLASPAEAGVSRYWHRAKHSYTVKMQNRHRARVGRDVQRLESVLSGMKGATKLSVNALRSAAAEADSLSVRILANVKSATAEREPVKKAEQLRTHVQNLKKEADSGNVSKTRANAERALNVATKLDEWAG